MKNLFLAATLLVCAVSNATSEKLSEVREFVVTKGEYASSHVSKAGQGTLTIDYAQSTVRLFVTRQNFCPVGMMCAAVMPSPLMVELPIVSIETDDCGTHTVIAKQDKRPVDGQLEVLTVKDVTDMTCPTFVPVYSEAIYQTSYNDRFQGKRVTGESKMILAPKKNQDNAIEKTSVLLKFQQNIAFSPRPSSRTITIESNGKVIARESFYYDNAETKTELATLSTAAIKILKEKLATVKADTELVDEDKDAPRCYDAPSSYVYATLNQKEVKIYATESCHTLKSYDGEAVSLVNFILGFTHIAR